MSLDGSLAKCIKDLNRIDFSMLDIPNQFVEWTGQDVFDFRLRGGVRMRLDEGGDNLLSLSLFLVASG